MTVLDVLCLVASFVLCSTSIVVVWRATKRMRILGIADHVKITREKPHLPDAVIEDEKPIPFPVGNGKNLYLQPLKEYEFSRYMNLYAAFLLALHNRAAGLQLANEEDSEEQKKKILEDWCFLAFDSKLRKLQLRLIKNVFLQSRDINPERVRVRDIKKMRIDRIVELWQRLHDRNVHAVESFARSLMTSLSGRENARAGSVFLGEGSTIIPFGTPLYQEKSSGQKEPER